MKTSRVTCDVWRVASGALVLIATLFACARHDVGSEKNNPAPSANIALGDAQAFGDQWAREDLANRRWSTPTPTSSMVPYMDSHSVLLLEAVVSDVRLHDILVMDEGAGRENTCHRVTALKDGYAYIDGANNTWPDGWVPLTATKWRVAGIIYSKGPT